MNSTDTPLQEIVANLGELTGRIHRLELRGRWIGLLLFVMLAGFAGSAQCIHDRL